MYSQEQSQIRLKFSMASTLLLALLCINVQLNAQKQSYHTLRSFQTVPHALQFDQGKLPNYRFFVGPPYVSNINLTTKTIGPTLSDLNLFGEGGLFGSDFDAILDVAEDFNSLEQDNKLDLVYFGYRP